MLALITRPAPPCTHTSHTLGVGVPATPSVLHPCCDFTTCLGSSQGLDAMRLICWAGHARFGVWSKLVCTVYHRVAM